MSKQTVNTGTSANDRTGDSLRTAFTKINANFTELYTALGLDELPLNLGAFEFTGSTITTTDSSSITIDQATNITSDLTVSGDVLPSVAQGGDLGSLTKPWRSLYVSSSTVYFGGVPLSLDENNNLLVDGIAIADAGTAAWANITGKPTFAAVATSGSYNDLSNKPAIPTDINELTDTGNLLFDGDYTGLSNVPTIPTDISELTDNTNLLSSGASGFTYNEVNGTSEIGVTADVFDFGDGKIIDMQNSTVLFTGSTLQGLSDPSGLTNNDDINLTIINDDSSSYTWNFDNTGVLTLPAAGDIRNSNGQSVLGSAASLTVTIPGEAYKGFGARYGRVYANSNSDELTVSKIVIFKDTASAAASTIHPTSSQDEFAVTGLADSDIVAMFVLYGDTNDEKSLDTLKAFARTAIDTVILNGGVEGQFNTIAAMRTAFYDNINTLAAVAGGLVANFEFWQNDFSISNGYLSSGATTVLEGSGAVFDIADNGDGTYLASGIQNSGTNYLAGHKIKVLGTELGGVTPDNDCIVTVGSVIDGGAIFQWSVSGTAAGGGFNIYGSVTGTNYQVGSGFVVDSLYRNAATGLIDGVNISSGGTGYVVGDILTVPGTAMTGGVRPDNDITITVTGVGNLGEIGNWNNVGTMPQAWPNNSISDGGEDQYDTANYINTNLANQISYNGGVVVEDATSEFGTGSKYVALYDSSIFGFIATGSSAASISTSGNSGADGNSTTDTGALFEVDRTYDPALTNLTLTNDPLRAIPVTFTKADYATANNVDVIEDDSTLQIGITRGNNQGIYNPFTEDAWDEDVSPQGTLWNTDSTDDLSDIESRTYTNFFAAYGGSLGNVVPGSTAILYVPTIEKYYLVEWTSWTQNNAGGGFAYTRTEIDVTQVEQGLRFADGSVLTTAEGLGRVKSTASGARRIEEVVGYKEVAVTERTEVVLTTTASRSVVGDARMWVDTTTTTIDDVLDDYTANQLNEDFPIQFSLDNATWYNYNGGYSSSGDERGFTITTPVTYNQGDTIYFRYTSGGLPVTWWNKSELPGGSSNFRGAVIDYHAWTGESTIIGTIHIVDDSGENHISHQEVQSGSTDGENDDLWLVTSEGQIRYRRIDGESKTLKIHWTAKVFYGSEFWD